LKKLFNQSLYTSLYITTLKYNSKTMNWPKVEDSIVSIDELQSGYCPSDNEYRHNLEDNLRDMNI